MTGKADIKCFSLLFVEGKLISIRGDTVPESFDEFETLGEG